MVTLPGRGKWAPHAALRLSVYGETYFPQPPHLALAGHELPSQQPGTRLVLAQTMPAESKWRVKQGDSTGLAGA